MLKLCRQFIYIYLFIFNKNKSLAKYILYIIEYYNLIEYSIVIELFIIIIF